jgi:hypothetical protein
MSTDDRRAKLQRVEKRFFGKSFTNFVMLFLGGGSYVRAIHTESDRIFGDFNFDSTIWSIGKMR